MSSSVPAVVAALESVAGTALPAGAQVVNSTVPMRWQPGPGEVATVNSGVTLQITSVHFLMDAFAELGPNYKHEEHYNIICNLCAWQGGPADQPALDQLMQDVFTCYADLTIAIAQNMRLGLPDPKPRIAWPRQLNWANTPDAFGRPASCIDFEIEVQARVESLS